MQMPGAERRLAAWLDRVSASQTSPLLLKMEALKEAGVAGHDLGVGDADNIVLAPHVRDAAIAAIREDDNGYTPTAGTMALRRAAADRLRADHGLAYEAGEIVVSVGAKHAIFNAIVSLC